MLEQISALEWSLLVIGSIVVLLLGLWAGTQEGVRPPKRVYPEGRVPVGPLYTVREYQLERMIAMSVVTDLSLAASGADPWDLARPPDPYHSAISNQTDPETGQRVNYLVGPWFRENLEPDPPGYLAATRLYWQRWAVRNPDPDAIPTLVEWVKQRKPQRSFINLPVWGYDPNDTYPLLGV